MGYLGDAAATRRIFDAAGYLHTGDVGCIDADGLVHVTDRIKELIKVKGQQVAPAELEDLLLGVPDVLDAAVVGVRDTYSGEVPKAFVVLKKKTVSSSQGLAWHDEKEEEERMRDAGRRLLDYVRAKKVRYKWLKEIEFVEAVPKSPTGKLLRRVLKGWENGEDKDRKRGLVVRDERLEKSKL